jgi:tetratricopeptide (TPR) repeat protein
MFNKPRSGSMTPNSAEPTSAEEAQEALRAARSALHDSDPGSENRESLLENLGHTLVQDYDVSRQQATVDEAIIVYEEILRLQPEGHGHRALSLANFGGILQRLSEDHAQSEVHLDRAIVLLRESLRLRPPGDSARAQSLSSLGNALLTCFHQRGHAAVLVEAGLLHAEALSLCPVGSEDRDNSLNHLANVRFAQFQLNGAGETGSIAHVVALYREALELRPLGHVWRDVSLSNLGNALLVQYRFEGNEDTLNEATQNHREALGLRSCSDPLRGFFLQSLGDALLVCYAAHLSRDILAEAVALYRDAVQLRPEGDFRRDQALTALAGALLCNFGEYGIWDSLAEAIALYREVLSRCARTHRDGVLSHLANALQSGFWIRPDLTVLNEIIDLHREALQLRPPGHLTRWQTLIDYANALGNKFEYEGDTDALALAVALHRESVEARRPGDPQRYMSLGNLARTLYVQAAYSGQVDSLPKAIAAKREALRYCLDGHPDRSWLRLGLGVCLLMVHSPLFDYDEAMSHIIAGLGDDYASARKRLQLTLLEFRRVEGACAHAIRELNLPTSHCSAQMLKAYRLIIRLQLRVASLGLDHQTRLQVIAGTDEVSRNAAAHALRLELLPDAVEILEEGRGIFWTQALRLRASELDGLFAEDGITLRTIFQSLEKRESAADKGIVHAAQRDVNFDHRRRLSDQAEALISDIRTRPGFEPFLMPPSFDALMQTLPEGYVILLVVSALGCDALLLNGPAGIAQSIRLTLIHGTFNAAAIRSRLPRDANSRDVNEDIADEFRAMRVSSKRHEGLEGILASMWSSVVHPIVQALALKVRIGSALYAVLAQTSRSPPRRRVDHVCGGASQKS